MSGARRYDARADDGVALALHRVAPAAPSPHPPVLLVPGTFTTRAFWLGGRGSGFAAALAEAGFDAWVLEPRGHGESARPARWTLHDWIQLDAPAAVRAVLAGTGAESCFWVGHSAGGVVGAAFAGAGGALARRLHGLVLLGAPGPGSLAGLRRLGALGLYLLAALLPGARMPGWPLGLGPEHEPARLLRQWMGWNLRGTWRDPHGGDYLAALAAVHVPLLCVAGAGDHLLAPAGAVRDLEERFGSRDRTLLVAGRGTGFGRDYDHAGLVLGRAAREEIWPRVIGWLTARSGAAVADIQPSRGA